MTSEWMRVMLEEIARKKEEAEQAQLEREKRAEARREEEAESAPPATRPAPDSGAS